MFLCVCKAVRMSEAVDAAKDGYNSPESIRQFFGFDDDDECCGRCAEDIEQVTALVHVELCKANTATGLYPSQAAA